MFICNKIKQVVFPKIPAQKGRFQINSLVEKLWNQMTLDFENACFNFVITLMGFLLIPKSNTESAVILIKVLGVACWEKRCSAKANIFSHLKSQWNFFYLYERKIDNKHDKHKNQPKFQKIFVEHVHIKTFCTRAVYCFETLPTTARCCFSIPPENLRKPLGFLMFSVSINKQHRTFLSVQYCSDLKKVLSMEILVSMIISKLVGKPSCFEHTEGRLVVLKFPCYTDFAPVW